MNFENSVQITGETPFRVFSTSMWIPSTTTGYTLKYSGNGVTYQDREETVPANEECYVRGFSSGMWFILEGNTDTVLIKY